MTKLSYTLSLLLLASALSGCNSTRSAPPEPQLRSNVTPSTFRMPEGGGCSGDVARYRAVIDNDVTSGNVNQSVSNTINDEIDQAAAACSAGKDGEARALVRASKSRHGYPGG